MHLCWGNYPGLITVTYPSRTCGPGLDGQATLQCSSKRESATCTRVVDFEDVKLPEGKMLIPGVIEVQSITSSIRSGCARIGTICQPAGRDNVMPAPTVDSAFTSGLAAWIPTWCGPSWRCSHKALSSPAGVSGAALSGFQTTCIAVQHGSVHWPVIPLTMVSTPTRKIPTAREICALRYLP